MQALGRVQRSSWLKEGRENDKNKAAFEAICKRSKHLVKASEALKALGNILLSPRSHRWRLRNVRLMCDRFLIDFTRCRIVLDEVS